MMTAQRLAVGVAATLILSACDAGSSSAPGAVSPGEAEALEEAAEMLEERRLPDGALPPVDAPANGEAAPEPSEEADQE